MKARYRVWVWSVALLVAVCLLPGTALAHAHLVRADLAPDSHLLVPGGTYRFWFDEALNPALSRIQIKNAQGTQVNVDTGKINPANALELDVHIAALPAGQYTVYWTSDSAQDGHILHGFYLFTAGGAGAQAISAQPTGIVAVDQPQLDTTALAGALAHWLVLVASTVWTGALVLELLVVAPVRKRARSGLAALSGETSAALARIVRIGLFATLVTNVAELIAQAYAAGGWGNLTSSITDILNSHYGTYWLLRVILAAVALLVVMFILVPSVAELVPQHRGRSPQRVIRHYLPAVEPASARVLGLLGLLYLLALALSGHAAAVSQLLFTSVVLDWLHLLANSVWIGGMAAIALALIPSLQRISARGGRNIPLERAAFLDVLDRFSPAAYVALPAAALTGMFNAQVHLSSFDQLFNTAYGRFLLIKLVLIAEIMAISASHVFFTRPRLRALGTGQSMSVPAESALASLIARLQVEPLIGALILLCVALMGQVAPAVTVFTVPTGGPGAAANPTSTTSSAIGVTPPALPKTIRTTVQKGVLGVTLTVDPAAVTRARFFVTVQQRGKPVTDAQVRIKLSVPEVAGLGDTFVETTPTNGGYQGAGDLVQNGQWRADVLVRTHDDPLEFRDVPFDFLVGPGAAFLQLTANAAHTAIAASPGQVQGPNTFTLSGIQASSVRLLSESLDMDMGVVTMPATSLGQGRWRVANAYSPMNGHWGLIVQAQQAGGPWVTLRQFEYNVPLQGSITLLSTHSTASSTGTAGAGNLNSAFNVAFARSLPYTALVTEMGSNGVRLLGGAFLPTGVQAHGVDVLDGTPYAYVTNFGAEPGTVTQINIHTMRVVRTFTVGLGPAHIVFTPDQRRAFVTDFRSNDLYVLDLRKGTSAPILFPDGTCFEPHGLDISEDGSTLFVACAGGAWIYTVNTTTLKPGRTVVTGPGAYGVAVDAPRHEVWVTNQTVSTVSVLDEHTLKLLATVKVGKGPALLVPTPDGRRVYVADQLGGQVSVIDAASRRVIATIPVAAQPHGPDATKDGKYVYVASIGGNAVTIIRVSDNHVVAVVPAPAGSNEVAISN